MLLLLFLIKRHHNEIIINLSYRCIASYNSAKYTHITQYISIKMEINQLVLALNKGHYYWCLRTILSSDHTIQLKSILNYWRCFIMFTYAMPLQTPPPSPHFKQQKIAQDFNLVSNGRTLGCVATSQLEKPTVHNAIRN